MIRKHHQRSEPHHHIRQNKDCECEVAAGFHRHCTGVHDIQQDALARRPGVPAVRRPSHPGWQVLMQEPGGREGAGAQGQRYTYFYGAVTWTPRQRASNAEAVHKPVMKKQI